MPNDLLERITFKYEPDNEFIGFRFYSNIKEENLKKRLGLTDDNPVSIENKIAFFFSDKAFPGLSGITNQWAYAEYRLPEGFPFEGDFPFATFPRTAPWDFTSGQKKSVKGATLTRESDQPTPEGLFTYEINFYDAKVTNLEGVLLLEDTKFPTGALFKEFPTKFRTFLEAYAQNSRKSNCSTYANERYRLAENTGFTVDLSEINIQARIIEPFGNLSEPVPIRECNCCGELAAQIRSNTEKLDDNTVAIAQNKSVITSNTRDIKENSKQIRNNTKDIQTNMKDIAKNKRAIDCLACKPKCHGGHPTICSWGTGVVLVGALLLAGLSQKSHTKKCAQR